MFITMASIIHTLRQKSFIRYNNMFYTLNSFNSCETGFVARFSRLDPKRNTQKYADGELIFLSGLKYCFIINHKP